MYKLVRDDYKADKSNLHIAYTNLMIAAILLITEPSKVKDIQPYLEAIVQTVASATEVGTYFYTTLISYIDLV